MDDLVVELDELREEGIEDVSHIRGIYDYLDKSKAPVSNLRYVQRWSRENKFGDMRLTQGQSCV